MKIDLGSGPNPGAGFEGCDRIAFPGVTHVFDIGQARWPFEDSSIEEARSSHFIEHLDSIERVYFFNELYRVLVPGAKCFIIVPYWASGRAYGDPTHKWPPFADFAALYLLKSWRMQNAPHSDKEHWEQGYYCDFDAVGGYNLHPELNVFHEERKQFATKWYREAIWDMFLTLTSRKEKAPSSNESSSSIPSTDGSTPQSTAATWQR